MNNTFQIIFIICTKNANSFFCSSDIVQEHVYIERWHVYTQYRHKGRLKGKYSYKNKNENQIRAKFLGNN